MVLQPKNIFCVISVILNWLRFYSPGCSLPRCMFHVYLRIQRRLCILLLLDGEFQNSQMDPSDGYCLVGYLFLYWISGYLFCQFLRGILISPITVTNSSICPFFSIISPCILMLCWHMNTNLGFLRLFGKICPFYHYVMLPPVPEKIFCTEL